MNHSIFRTPAFTFRLTSIALLANLAFGQQQQNIWNNGGFESGLMCYASIIWAKSGKSFPSDYHFQLSSDSHSGSNSIEIRCTTSDCEKAAIVSSKIPTPGNQSYTLSLYTKCPAGRQAAVYIPDTKGGDTFVGATCNGSWALNKINFTTAETARDFFFYVYNRDVEWMRIDDILLTYADGSVPESSVQHAGVRTVSISGQSLIVDGSPYFALGFFDVNYQDLPTVAALGANTINGTGLSAPADCSRTGLQSYLDRAYELNLNFTPDSSSTARLASPDALGAAVAQFSPHLANILWFLADEPDQAQVPAWYIPADTLVAEYQTIKSQLPIPVAADFQRAAWSVPSETLPYAAGVDLWIAEPYGADFGSINHAITTFNGLAAKPIWLAQDDIDAGLIVPKAYWAAISGATGILYFNWDSFKAVPAKRDAASQVFRELTQLTPAIFADSLDSQITPPFGVGSIARSLNGLQYILAANPSPVPVQGSFAVPGLVAGTTVQVLFEDRSITADAEGFRDTFSGVTRHVYVIGSAAPSDPSLARRSGAHADTRIR